MSQDQDHGTGDEERFPADDLEKLYKQGGMEPTTHVQGRVLN